MDHQERNGNRRQEGPQKVAGDRLNAATSSVRTGLLIACLAGTALSLGIFIDTCLSRSVACRGIQQYLGRRWNRALGIEGGGSPPGQVGRAVDQLVGGLPLPPKSTQVVRGEDLRNLGRDRDAPSPPIANGTGRATGEEATGCPAGDDAGPYASRLRSLLGALRIFAGCNLGLFLLTALLVGRGRARSVDCLVPATLLAATTLVSSIIYFAARDWFWSFLDGDYAGFGYLLIVGLIAALLADIVWNGACVVRFVLRLLWWVPV